MNTHFDTEVFGHSLLNFDVRALGWNNSQIINKLLCVSR